MIREPSPQSSPKGKGCKTAISTDSRHLSRLLLAKQADDHVELDQLIFARIAHDTQRLAALLRGLNLLAQKLSKNNVYSRSDLSTRK